MKKVFSLLIAAVLGISSAFATTVYCKMDKAWWTVNGAAVAVHYWGGASASTTWPGVRMAAVAGEEGMWSYDVPADVTGLVFARVNGSGDLEDWGAKTGDLTLPTDDKNLFTISNEEECWGGLECLCEGEWSVYVPAEGGEGGEEEQGVVLPVVKLAGSLTSWEEPVLMVNAEDSLSATLTLNLGIDDYQLKVVSDGNWLTRAGNDGMYEMHRDWNHVDHLNLINSGDNIKLITDVAGEYTFTWTYADSTLVVTFPEKPETVLADGYYLIGNINGVEVLDWTVENINKNYLLARNTDATENEEYKIEVTLAEGDAFQVVSVANDVIAVWYPGGTENNYVVDAEHAGQSVIYFRPNADGGEDWFHNKIYVAAAGGTGIDNTAIDAKAEKMIKNGMLLIIKGDKTYNVIGQIVK